MSFVFHFYIPGLTSWIWTNPSTEELKFESPSKWNSYEGFNLENNMHGNHHSSSTIHSLIPFIHSMGPTSTLPGQMRQDPPEIQLTRLVSYSNPWLDPAIPLWSCPSAGQGAKPTTPNLTPGIPHHIYHLQAKRSTQWVHLVSGPVPFLLFVGLIPPFQVR